MSANEAVLQSANTVRQMNGIYRMIIDAETSVRGFLITGNEKFLDPQKNANKDLPRMISNAQIALPSNADKTKLDRIFQAYKSWYALSAESVDAKRKGTWALGEGSEERKEIMDGIRKDIEGMIADLEDLRDAQNDDTTSRTFLFLALMLVSCIVVGAIVGVFGRRQLLDLSQSYEDTLRDRQNQNLILQEQAWMREGQAKIAFEVRGELSIEQIGIAMLNALARYLGADVGAIYYLQESQRLIPLSGYAIDTATLPSIVVIGDGFVGQVARDLELKKIMDVPSTYFKVKSALGEKSPRHIIVAPVTSDGLIQGVVELGFEAQPAQRVSDFLTQSAELIGIAMRSAIYRNRLHDLLNESQQLTEELQTQQEELRVSNEELAERSNVLMEAQAKMQNQQAELEQTNSQLEEQAQALEEQKQSLDQQNQRLTHAQATLQQKSQELEAASRYKSEFLANMSHELRTPLNSSLILAKLLKDNPTGNLTDEQVNFASTIYNAGNDLLTLINDILDLSKVEAGKLEVFSEKISLAKIIKGIENLFRPACDEKGLAFDVSVAPDVPDVIETDRQRLEQIIRNLLSNAVKFTKQGSVALKVSMGVGSTVKFTISDTGTGIDPANHDLIFEAFKQADGTTNRKYGGTGLGLSISRNLASLLGGEITLSSALGEGSTFCLSLPLMYTPATVLDQSSPFVPTNMVLHQAPSQKARTQALEAKTAFLPFIDDDREIIDHASDRVILVVEDEKQFAEILYLQAKESGFKCVVASTAAEGVELAKRFMPKAVILDMKLPDASGLTLLDQLKLEAATRHIPVHAISAADLSREALRLGAVGYLRKPASRSDLSEIFKVLEAKMTQTIKRVLIVEDDDVQRSSIEKLIRSSNVSIKTVGTATEAFEELKKSTFDCMITDLSLPDMSGFEMLERMSENQRFGFPPVIVYTGRSLSRAEEERLQRYSRTIIIKGAKSPERLIDEVTLFLHQVEADLPVDKQKSLQALRHRGQTFEGRTILLVDDDVRNIFALTSMLEYKGAKVVVARNGLQALTKLDEESGIDLVLMDIMMPEMDGLEAMRRIRADAKFKNLPIIAVTAKAMKDDYEKCLEAGANDYLAKPVDVERLVSLMRVWLSKV